MPKSRHAARTRTPQDGLESKARWWTVLATAVPSKENSAARTAATGTTRGTTPRRHRRDASTEPPMTHPSWGEVAPVSLSRPAPTACCHRAVTPSRSVVHERGRTQADGARGIGLAEGTRTAGMRSPGSPARDPSRRAAVRDLIHPSPQMAGAAMAVISRRPSWQAVTSPATRRATCPAACGATSRPSAADLPAADPGARVGYTVPVAAAAGSGVSRRPKRRCSTWKRAWSRSSATWWS